MKAEGKLKQRETDAPCSQQCRDGVASEVSGKPPWSPEVWNKLWPQEPGSSSPSSFPSLCCSTWSHFSVYNCFVYSVHDELIHSQAANDRDQKQQRCRRTLAFLCCGDSFCVCLSGIPGNWTALFRYLLQISPRSCSFHRLDICRNFLTFSTFQHLVRIFVEVYM